MPAAPAAPSSTAPHTPKTLHRGVLDLGAAPSAMGGLAFALRVVERPFGTRPASTTTDVGCGSAFDGRVSLISISPIANEVVSAKACLSFERRAASYSDFFSGVRSAT